MSIVTNVPFDRFVVSSMSFSKTVDLNVTVRWPGTDRL
jgi:hypothetical protein